MDIIYSAGEIANRIAQLGREITEFYRGEELTVVALMNGALPFAADLIRAIGLDCYVDTVSVASYRNCRSTGEPELPPVMSQSARKQVGSSPAALA